MNAIQEQRLRVRHDISVIGCDDILFAQMSNPKLSTISVPAYQIGVTAVDMLVERIKGVRSSQELGAGAQVHPKRIIIGRTKE